MIRNKLTFLVLTLLLLSACSKYGYVTLNYPQEPLVYLPDQVKSIAVVNRSLTTEKEKDKRLIEAIATGEVAGSDRLASDECLKGVYDGIHGQYGINIVFPKELRISGTGTRETPDILDWKMVADICESNKADALLVLETFDSNSDLLVSTAAGQISSVLSGVPPRPAIPSQVRMDVVCYWRLYDPSDKTIIDQYQQTSFLTFSTQGMMPPPDALPRTAYAAGKDYVLRFLPSYYTVKRDMYKRAKGPGKHEFRAGFRRAEVANWDGAIELWNGVIDNAKRKTAGRACLNIAVAYEVLGNTDLALEWAQKSYEIYNNKLGRQYAKILLRRKNIEY
jgi:hypothetical protein